jgi:hypothetical protein
MPGARCSGTTSVEVAEYRRKFRVLDQMLSSHATLCERYRRRATGLILVIMALSIVSGTLALQDDHDATVLGINLETKEWLALLAGTIFFLSIAELVVDWRGRAWAHADAAQRLGELKGDFRRAEVSGGIVDTKGIDLDEAYDQTTAAIVEIPNSLFGRLKAKHRRKIAVSKLLDDSPGAPILLLRWRVLREGIAKSRQWERGRGVLEESPPGGKGGGE